MFLRLLAIINLILLCKTVSLCATEQSTIANNGNKISEIDTETSTEEKRTEEHEENTAEEPQDMTGIITHEVEYELKGKLKLHDSTRFLVEYQVVTSDGYILSIFRMKSRKRDLVKRNYPVLMFHGLLQSSDIFIEHDLDRAFVFKLQDLGYDVWLGNARGNKYSRVHLYVEPDSYEENYRFFNYTFDEIGLYDISATVEYIIHKTNKPRVHFVGHSQGGTAFLVLNSVIPTFNLKFVAAHLLAPLGYQEHFSNLKLTPFTEIGDAIYEMLTGLGILEVFPYYRNSPSYTSIDDCLGHKKYQDICKELQVNRLMALDEDKFKTRDTKGGAIKQIAHYAQNIKSKIFRRWDHGIEKNKVVYGTAEPPRFNLSLIRTRTIIHYASQDEFIDPRDILNMVKDLANGQAIKVSRDDFKHYDFLYGPDKMERVFNKVVKDMNYWDVRIDDPMPDSRVTSASSRLSISLMSYLIPLVALILT